MSVTARCDWTTQGHGDWTINGTDNSRPEWTLRCPPCIERLVMTLLLQSRFYRQSCIRSWFSFSWRTIFLYRGGPFSLQHIHSIKTRCTPLHGINLRITAWQPPHQVHQGIPQTFRCDTGNSAEVDGWKERRSWSWTGWQEGLSLIFLVRYFFHTPVLVKRGFCFCNFGSWWGNKALQRRRDNIGKEGRIYCSGTSHVCVPCVLSRS